MTKHVAVASGNIGLILTGIGEIVAFSPGEEGCLVETVK